MYSQGSARQHLCRTLVLASDLGSVRNFLYGTFVIIIKKMVLYETFDTKPFY